MSAKINAWWVGGARGMWDQGLLMDLLDGDLWPVEMEFEQHMDPPPLRDGTVIVASGTCLHHHPDQAATVERIGQYPWALFCLTSDESRQLNRHQIKCPRLVTWQQYTTPKYKAHRQMLLGWPADCRPILLPMLRLPLAERPLRWAFAGQITHRVRDDMAANLMAAGGGEMHSSPGFGQGLGREDYYRLLTQARIAPCPTGPVHPDSFRLYEALEAGCLPVCSAHAPGGPQSYEYWPWVLDGPPPFPVVEQWSEFKDIFDRYQDDIILQRDANKAAAWWLGYKRQVALDMVDDVALLSGKQPTQHPVTVLMPTSPIGRHPSAELIKDSIRKIRAYPELQDAEIIIMVDGLRDEQSHYAFAYEEYKRRLIEHCNWDYEFQGCLPLIFDEHTHQANMTRKALALVRSPYVFFVEHDTWPDADIPWDKFFLAMEDERVKCIRLHIFHEVLEVHQHLYDTEKQVIADVPLIKTLQWSQRPHLACTSWYRWIIQKHFPLDAKTMIEDRMYKFTANAREMWNGWEPYNMWIYAPEGDMTRSRSDDGRQDDPKYPMDFGTVKRRGTR